MTIDFSKPVQTRDGRPVEIITTKGRGSYPVIGYIGENERLDYWMANGDGFITLGCAGEDLVNVPEERELWLNVYESGVINEHSSRERADNGAGIARIACVHVKYKVGEGLE